MKNKEANDKKEVERVNKNMSKAENKKGQITLFVILGIVLLIILALIFLLRKQGVTEQPGVKEAKIDLEFVPIQSYVTSCLYAVGKDGIMRLGAHGGYIEPLKFGIRSNPVMPTESNGISFFDDSEVIPYWFYLKSNNKCKQDCVVSSEQPPITDGDKSMQAQLASYVEENLANCLSNLSAFKESQGIDSQIIGKPTIQAYIKDKVVTLVLKQTIKATYQGKEQSLESFTSDIPVNLKQDYYIMSKLIDYSINPATRFFERKTVQIIGAYGMGKHPDIPPIGSSMELGSDTSSWQLTAVNKRIREILEDHISLFSVDQTRNSEIILTSDPTFNGMYLDFIIDNTFIPNPEDYTINFAYLQDWPIYANVNPSKGGFIKVETQKIPIFEIPISAKDFYYDVSYPMIIVVRDEEAFGGEGFAFQAAIEVNVRSNQPLNITGESPLLTGESTNLFCDYKQRKSGDITITATSSDNNIPEDTSISYECGDESCFVGSPDQTGSLTTKLPLCANGLVSASAEDYFSSPAKLSTNPDKPDSVNINLERFSELSVDIKKVVLTKITGTNTVWLLDPAKATDLDQDDKATIILSREPKAGESDVVESVQINGKNLDETKSIKIIQGDYELSGFIATNLGSDSVSKKVITITDPDTRQTITLDDFFYTGEINLDKSTSGLVTITKDDLGMGKITFFIPYIDVNDITTLDELVTSQDALGTFSTSNRNDLLPRFG